MRSSCVFTSICCASLDVDVRETKRERGRARYSNCISVLMVLGPVYSSNWEFSHHRPAKSTYRVAPALDLICCYMSEGFCRPGRLHLHNGGLENYLYFQKGDAQFHLSFRSRLFDFNTVDGQNPASH